MTTPDLKRKVLTTPDLKRKVLTTPDRESMVVSTPFSMICGQQKQPCQSDVLKIRPYESRPTVMSNQHLVPSLMVKFDRYTFLKRQVEVGRCPAAWLAKKTSWVNGSYNIQGV